METSPESCRILSGSFLHSSLLVDHFMTRGIWFWDPAVGVARRIVFHCLFIVSFSFTCKWINSSASRLMSYEMLWTVFIYCIMCCYFWCMVALPRPRSWRLSLRGRIHGCWMWLHNFYDCCCRDAKDANIKVVMVPDLICAEVLLGSARQSDGRWMDHWWSVDS